MNNIKNIKPSDPTQFPPTSLAQFIIGLGAFAFLILSWSFLLIGAKADEPISDKINITPNILSRSLNEYINNQQLSSHEYKNYIKQLNNLASENSITNIFNPHEFETLSDNEQKELLTHIEKVIPNLNSYHNTMSSSDYAEQLRKYKKAHLDIVMWSTSDPHKYITKVTPKIGEDLFNTTTSSNNNRLTLNPQNWTINSENSSEKINSERILSNLIINIEGNELTISKEEPNTE